MLRLLSHQLVISVRQTLAHHASTVLPLGGDRALVAFFGGSREGGDDVNIWLAEKDENGFMPPRPITAHDVPCWNPVLFASKPSVVRIFSYRPATGAYRTF